MTLASRPPAAPPGDGAEVARGKGTRILFLNRIYSPNRGATGHLLKDLTEQLACRGRSITVVTGPSQQGDGSRDHQNGVTVERTRGFRFTRNSHLRRLMAYLSLYPFLLVRVLRVLRQSPADVTVIMTDPPLVMLLGPILKRLRGGHLVHWAQDVYPDVAETLGVLAPGGFLSRLFRRLTRWALRRFDHVVCVGRCMQERFMEHGYPSGQLSVIPNWANTKSIHPIPHAENAFRQEHGLDGRKVVMYSGNLGLAHPLEALVEAAHALQLNLPEALFLFVGDGPRLPWLRKQIAERPLSNIRVLPFQPAQRLAESLSAADLHLACMERRLSGLVVPSKVYGILAAGRPCLFLGPETSEAAHLVLQANCGEVLDPEDGKLLADRIIWWMERDLSREQAGIRARRAAEAHGIEAAAEAFDSLFSRIIRVPNEPAP